MSVFQMGFSCLSDSRVQLALLVVVLAVVYLRWTKKKNWPPGPMALPLVGNIFSFSKSPPAYVQMAKWAETYGDVFSIQIGLLPVVVLNSIDSIREAFIHKGNDFAGRPMTFTVDISTDGGKDIALGDFGPVWKVQRKIAHNAIRKYASGKHLESLIHDSVDTLTDLVRKQKEPFDPLEYLTLTVYNLLMSICCGKHYDLHDPEFQKVFQTIEETNDLFGSGLPADFVPVLKYLPETKTVKKLRKNINIISVEFMGKILDEKRKSFDPDSINDLIDHIIENEREAQTEEAGITQQLTPEHFKQVLMDLFFAGTDTSRYTLQWVISLLAGNPEVQEKMQQEIDDVIGQSQPVSLKDRDKLPYTNAVFHEVLRMRPVATLAIPHKTTCDTSVGGYDLPKGTQVIPNIWAIHMDKKEWKDPEIFMPERWIDEDGKFFPSSRSFLPFSTGRRVCVGEALAKAELVVFVAMIFQRFTFSAPSGVELTHELGDIGLAAIAKPFKIVAKERI